MIEMEFGKMKATQMEEAEEQLEQLITLKLETVFTESTFIQRMTPLSADQATGVVIGSYNAYVAQLAVATNQTKEEFLAEMAEEYDLAMPEEESEALESGPNVLAPS